MTQIGIENRPETPVRARFLTIGVDFHGVICMHPEGEQGRTDMAWPAVPGAIEWLKGITETYNVHIVSARFSPFRGARPAMEAAANWLVAQGIPRNWFVALDGPPRIVLSPYKPACSLWIDDRAFCFAGTFPTAEEIGAFRPWNRS